MSEPIPPVPADQELPPQTAHKAYAAAAVAILAFLIGGFTTGDWTGVDSVVEALAVLLLPVIVWLVPNKPVQ